MENPPEDSDAAFAYAQELGWLPKNAMPEESATLSGISLLLVEAFNLKGGFMYRLSHSPRYAYRAMLHQGFIRGRSYPQFTVSGEGFLLILGRLTAYKEQLDENG
jgi:hypothetical protein